MQNKNNTPTKYIIVIMSTTSVATNTPSSCNTPSTIIINNVQHFIKSGNLDLRDMDLDKNSCRYKKKSQCAIVAMSKRGEDPSLDDTCFFACAAVNCNKIFHLACYKAMINNDKSGSHVTKDNSCPSLSHPSSDTSRSVFLVCGKQCYSRMKRDLFDSAGGGNKLKRADSGLKFWDNDGKPDGPSSMDILLDWITNELNSDKYFGAKDTSNRSGEYSIEDGETKLGLCKKISEQIQSSVGVERSADSVRSKIDDLVAKFKITNDWINNTGQGVLETEGEATFREIVESKFKYYYHLEPVLLQRPSIRPAYTTDDFSEDNQIGLDDSESEDQDIEKVVGSSSFSNVTNHRKASAIEARDEWKKVRKLGSSGRGTPVNTTIGFSTTNDHMEQYLIAKKDLFHFQQRNEAAKVKVEEERLELDRKRFELELQIMKSNNQLSIAENNMKILAMRKKANEDNPTLTVDELEQLFPFYYSA